jgi:beta-lactamase superfamily II metal-dependent hydrolase
LTGAAALYYHAANFLEEPMPSSPSRLALALLVSLAAAGAAPPPSRGLDITWCDVEGGAATLIVTPAGESILVDAGNPGDRDAGRVVAAARAAGLTRIDHLILTHWHGDHVGGVAEVAKSIPIARFYDHGRTGSHEAPPEALAGYLRVGGERAVTLRPGDRIALRQTASGPRVSLSVVAAGGRVLGERDAPPQIRACTAGEPHPALPIDESDNARSVAFVLRFGDWSLFDGGDLTWNAEHRLACPEPRVGPVTVYQTTHHGADNSNNPAILRVLRPRVAVMNNGPAKGGTTQSVRALRALPGLEGFFAVHRNVGTGPEDNAAPALTANDDAACQGAVVHLAVAPDSRSFTVTVPAKGTVRSFTTGGR